MIFLYTTLLVITIVTFVISLLKIYRSSLIVTPIMGWMVGLLYFIVLPLLILVVNNGYELPDSYGVTGYWGKVDLDDTEFFYPFLIIWVSLMLTAVITYLFSHGSGLTNLYAYCFRIQNTQLKKIILICALFSLTEWASSIISVGGVDNYFQTHWYTRHDISLENFGQLYVIFLWISMAIQVISTAAIALLVVGFIRRQHRDYLMLFFSLSMLILNMFMTGNRIFIALFLLYIISAVLVYRQWRWILILLLMVPFGAGIFSVWAHVRGNMGDFAGGLEAYKERSVEFDSKIMTTLMDVTEGSNVMILMHIIRDFGPRYELLLGLTYSKVLTFVIPRSIYPDKPDSFSVISAKIYEPDANTSLSSTVLGEMYANFGVLAVLLLPLFTLVILLICQRISHRIYQNMLLSTVLFIMFAWMARTMFSDNFIAIVFCILIIWSLRLEKGLFCPAPGSKILFIPFR